MGTIATKYHIISKNREGIDTQKERGKIKKYPADSRAQKFGCIYINYFLFCCYLLLE